MNFMCEKRTLYIILILFSAAWDHVRRWLLLFRNGGSSAALHMLSCAPCVTDNICRDEHVQSAFRFMIFEVKRLLHTTEVLDQYDQVWEMCHLFYHWYVLHFIYACMHLWMNRLIDCFAMWLEYSIYIYKTIKISIQVQIRGTFL